MNSYSYESRKGINIRPASIISIVMFLFILSILLYLLLRILKTKNLMKQTGTNLSSNSSENKCMGIWSDWSVCSDDCNGTQTRIFTLDQSSDVNANCPMIDTRKCNTTCINKENLNNYFMGNESNIALPTKSTNLTSSYETDAYKCAQKCMNDPLCEAYGWSNTTGKCDLLDIYAASMLEFGDGFTPIGWSDYHVGVKIDKKRNVKDDETLQQYFDISNQAQFGPSVDKGKTTISTRIPVEIDMYSCAELCNDDSTCVSYGYYTDSHICDLYHTKQTQLGQPVWNNYRVGKKKNIGEWK